MRPASFDAEIEQRATTESVFGRSTRRLKRGLRWRMAALVYALIVLAVGAAPLGLLWLSVDRRELLDRLPFVVLEALALTLGVVAAELVMALWRRAGSRQGDDGRTRAVGFSGDSGGAQAASAGHSNHEYAQNSQPPSTNGRSAPEPVARGTDRE